MLQQARDVVGHMEVGERQAQELLASVAVHPHRPFVHPQDPERLRVAHPHGVRVLLEQNPVRLLGPAQGVLEDLRLRHILRHGDRPRGRSARVAKRTIVLGAGVVRHSVILPETEARNLSSFVLHDGEGAPSQTASLIGR